MVKWYYFLAAQILILFLVFIALASPWYSMEHNASGTLSSGANVIASGTMFTGESMGLRERNRYHGASSSPQIFRPPLADNSQEDYEDMPRVKEVMDRARRLTIMTSVFCITCLAMLTLFLFVKSGRKHLKIAMMTNCFLLVCAASAAAATFYKGISPAVGADLENTIYSHLFDHITLENLTVPAQATGEYENFHTTREQVYERLSNGTVYEESLSGSSVENYGRDYSALSMKLRASSVLLWHPSTGWYLMLSLLLPGLAAVFFAFRLDPNIPVPFSSDGDNKSLGKGERSQRRKGKNRTKNRGTEAVLASMAGGKVKSSELEEGFLPVPDGLDRRAEPDEGFMPIGNADAETPDFFWNR